MTKHQEFIFATGNPNKVKEVQENLPEEIKILSLAEIGYSSEIPEDHDNLRDNAIQKAETIFNLTGMNCFSEDTGLEVEFLNGEPGVHSARYAGPQKNAEDNMDKLLAALEGSPNRKARFRTIFALILNGKKHCFEGIVNGTIIYERKGTGGFGYDPIFQPIGYKQTFGELSSKTKSEISHRSRALKKLIDFLNART